MFAVETLDGDHIGFTNINQINWRHRVGITGTIIGRRDLWGQGYATDAIRARTRYAFERLGLRLLLCEVILGNAASLRAVQKAGYREVGRIPGRYWKRGAYRDSIQLVADSESWQP
jgi:RimJ/RimL family protein N-acetyltransferase